MKKWIKHIGILVIVILLATYLGNSVFRENIRQVFEMLVDSNTEGLKEYIISFGIVGPIISILIMMLQAVIAPLPAFVVTFANAYIYGWKFGVIISSIGTYLGAVICFGLSRFYGRDMAERFVPAKFLDKCDSVFDKYGKCVVYASRLLPFISFDGVSYAAGLTKMSFKFFSIATIIGQIPLTVVISKLGENIDKPDMFLSQATICAILALICAIVLYIIYRKKYNGKSIKVVLMNFIKSR